MGLCKYIPLLIVFITPSYLDWALAALIQEEAAAKKFTSNEDIQFFFEQIRSLGEGYGTNWIVMPDGNGTAQLAVMKKDGPFSYPKRTFKSYTLETVTDLVTFHFFKNKREEDLKFQLKDLHNVAFVSTKPTKIICHGWMANSNSSVITGIRDAYLVEEDVNVIGVDWSPISDDLFYPNSAAGTELVGKVVGQLIDTLVSEHKARYSDFHIIGHSLGAHIAGFAGNSTQQKIGRITGLDPALPGFEYVSGPEGRLDNSDAEFVDVIHTCSGVLGISSPIGHVDFYPNGGSVFQPGCAAYSIMNGPHLTDIIAEACSHSRAHQFFAESISKAADFESVRCQDWDHFKKNQCEEIYTIMGEYIPKETEPGVYYLKTNWESPFAQGHEGINFLSV